MEKMLSYNAEKLVGEIEVPGDKSISHRAVMFGAISKGTTTIQNFLTGEDCLSTINCFQKLGVNIEEKNGIIIIDGKGWEDLIEPDQVLDVGNSGTTIRLMLGLLSGRPFHSTFVGDDSIAKRPMKRVTNPLRKMGATIDGRQNGEFVPITLRGGGLKPITYSLPVASAQVKSSLLLAALQTVGTSKITEPVATRDHTERMIKKFGGQIEVEDLTITITGPQTLVGTHINVPGDISSAAFFLVAAAIVPNAIIRIKNVGLNPTRTGIIDVLIKMGAKMEIIPNESEVFEPVGDIVIETSALKGIVIAGELIPKLIDEVPVIALLATQAAGKTIIKDAHELKVKETNRIDTVVGELKKLGADIVATEDGMIINGPTKLQGGHVSSHGDHRIGMMLSIAALICQEKVILDKSGAIGVSYPHFFRDLHNLIEKNPH
ncbi:3-phosphoshikimate 1-carboxyvinyltransferase [Pseudoneobacillus sp. C159]